MPEPLLPQRFLFRFSAPCRHCEPLWTPQGAPLDENYRLVNLAELEGRAPWAEVRAAWSAAGVAFVVHVSGKKQPAWCRATRPEDSDSFQVWLDTRDVHNVHRATRFCHRFVFLPTGAGRRLEEPMGQSLAINRAREQPRPALPKHIQVHSQKRRDGYVLHAFIAAEALTGFDPQEHPRLGFTYAVLDRELGEQTFGVGSPMAYQEDPSLWATLELAWRPVVR
jgi:hypothetical protein